VNQWTIALYLVIVWIILIFKLRCTSDIDEAQRAFSKLKFFWMGAADGLSGLASAIGGAAVSGQIQTLINQSNIPFT
jgi:hypothetical protein